jgi:2-hydroxychromene-2-carboxylate isomerase
MSDRVRFYFSFRSPYAWLAFHRLHRAMPEFGLEIDYVPLIPPRGFLDDMNPRKRRYIAEDVGRIARAYGFTLTWPEPFDTDWLKPHAAFLFAADGGRAGQFGAAIFRERFCAGRDVGAEPVLRSVAAECGLDADGAAAAGDSRPLRSRVVAGMRAVQSDGVFGVPYFVYRGHAYWGNDRLEWLLRDVSVQRGGNIPDLGREPLARPF